MKLFYPILFLLLTPLLSYSQGLHVDSTRFISGYECCTFIRYAIPTADKGILFVGADDGNPGGIIPFFPIDTGVYQNVLIGKIDSNRQISWIKVYGGTDDDGAVSTCQTADGGYAILATTASNDGDVTGFKGGGGDIWLLRLDASGNLLWEKTYGSTLQDYGISIANTPDNGFIILGGSNGSDDDVPFHYGDWTTFDWLVIKTDSAGNKQWSKDIGGTADEGGGGAILPVDGGYYLVSSSGSVDYDCTDTAWHPTVPGAGTGNNYFVLRLDNVGNVLWDSSYGGSHSDAVAYAMFDVRDSTIVINGTTNSDDYMVTGYQGMGDMWVLKIDKNGTLLWQKTLGSTNDETGTGICYGPNNSYLILGRTFQGPIGSGDCWLFALDNIGNKIYDRIFGGSDDENPNSIIPCSIGYAAFGYSLSPEFTDGRTTGRYNDGDNGFVTYIDSGILSTRQLISKESNLLIYPNPCDNKANVVISKNSPGCITVRNSIGEIIYNERVLRTVFDLKTDNWPSGLYLVKWQSDDGQLMITKLVKN